MREVPVKFKPKKMRYDVKAKRKNGKEWTEWTQSKTIERARWHKARIEKLGFLAKIVERNN